MAFTGNEGEEFPLATAAEWTANYRVANPKGIYGHFFGQTLLNAALAQSGCVGLRMYYALDDEGIQQMIVVGVDAEENDLYEGIIIERSSPCPPNCDTNGSPLCS